MVRGHNLHDIFKISGCATNLNLPANKPNGLKVAFHQYDNFEIKYEGKEPILPFAKSDIINAEISNWQRLTAVDSNCKDVYEVTFNITDSNIAFEPGDTIGIIPHNKKAEVDTVLKHLNLTSQADLMYNLSVDASLKGAKIPSHIPVRCTLRYVLTHCVDLRSVLKKLFLLALSSYTNNEDEKRVLEYLCSKEGSANYTTHVLGQSLCVLDVFAIFKSCKPSIEVLLSHLPRLLPRPYSIVNSGLRDPDVLKICFSVIDVGNNRRGLVTSWLEDTICNEDLVDKLEIMNINDSVHTKVPLYIRKNISEFRLPQNKQTPLILIGPGTGVAPFIAFLEERDILKEKDSTINLGRAWLFFGCRDPKLDYLYENEINSFLATGSLDKLSTAFSRVDNYENKYVQGAILQNGKEVISLIENDASVFICGDIKNMASQVKDVIVQCLVKYSNRSSEEAAQYIIDLQKQKRYFIDAWS